MDQVALPKTRPVDPLKWFKNEQKAKPDSTGRASRRRNHGVTGFTPGNCWGLGWCIIRQPQGVTAMLSPGTFGHGGASGTPGWVDPETETIYVLMVQRSGMGNSDGSEFGGCSSRQRTKPWRNERVGRPLPVPAS